MFAVFDQYELSDPLKIAEMKPVTGRIAVQAKYTPIDRKKKLRDGDLDAIGGMEEEESEEEYIPVQIGRIRVQVTDSRAFEQDLSHKLRFYIQGQDEIETTSVQENTKKPKWGEKFTFPVMKPPKGDDFAQLVIDDMDANQEDKILQSTTVDIGIMTDKPKNKLEKWCAFFNKTKKQVRLKILYLQDKPKP